MIARTTLLLAACAPAMADITLSRTVNSLAAGSSLNVTVEGSACSTKDAYGSNECDVHWGNTYTVDVAASLAEDLTTGSKIAVDLKLDGLVPFKASCAACGANCSVTVPIIKQSFNFAMPACPISVKAGIAKTISAALPAKSPVPLKIGVTGNIKVTDQAGAVVADIDIEGKVSPSGLALELEERNEEVEIEV